MNQLKKQAIITFHRNSSIKYNNSMILTFFNALSFLIEVFSDRPIYKACVLLNTYELFLYYNIHTEVDENLTERKRHSPATSRDQHLP